MKYIGFYATDDNMKNRQHSLAATNKMKYIAEAVTENNIDVEFISPSWSTVDSGWLNKEIKIINEKTTIQYFCSFGVRNKLLKEIRRRWSLLQLFLYLFFYTNQNEVVIVYHSPALVSLLKKIKKLKKIKIILEIEEVYANVTDDAKLRQKEYDFFEFVDAYIFPTEIMNEKINKKNKPYTIIYGTYRIEEQRNTKFDDDKIHIIYSGTFDEIKGGVYLAIESAKYLGKEYQLHILGFGSENQKKNVENYVEKINEISECVITYNGSLSGTEYVDFLQKCHIGLSTQNTLLEYNETSFPSKILSYMTNGLRVVSGTSKCLEKVKIRKLLHFYTENSPKEIAKVIKEIDLTTDYDSRVEVNKLNIEFVKEIKKLIEDIK